jgi:hypothetical protein
MNAINLTELKTDFDVAESEFVQQWEDGAI